MANRTVRIEFPVKNGKFDREAVEKDNKLLKENGIICRIYGEPVENADRYPAVLRVDRLGNVMLSLLNGATGMLEIIMHDTVIAEQPVVPSEPKGLDARMAIGPLGGGGGKK